MASAREQIEELIEKIAIYRSSPDESEFTDLDFLLTNVEKVLEDCMVELLDLPVAEHRSLLDRVIKAINQLGTVGAAVDKLLSIFK